MIDSRQLQQWIGLVLTAATLAATSAGAAEVRFFRTGSKEAFAQGTADAVSMGELGELTVGAATDEVAVLDEPWIYQAAADGDGGWVVGTGGAGRVLTVDAEGEVVSLPELAEDHVFAVAVGLDGTVWAGSSPSGQLYRWDGEAWTSYAIHRDDDLYIWALQPYEGGVYVATGARGRVLQVSVDGVVEDLTGELDTHVRSLRLLADGSLLAGTEGSGKIVRITGDRARVLHVAATPEITALAADGAGTCYAAVVKSPASWIATAAQQAASSTSTSAAGGGTATVTVTTGTANGDASASTTLLRFACDGGVVETIGDWEGETVYDLAVYGGDLWVATGQEGKIFRVDDEGIRFLVQDLKESQAVSLVPAASGLGIAASNAGRLFVIGVHRAELGTFESAVFDSGLLSRLGALSWTGDGEVEFAVRSGTSGTPDEGWSDWSSWRSGSVVDVSDVDDGRFLQWRARLHEDSRLSSVEIAYQQHNVAPRISEFEVLAPGEVLVDGSFNPGQQVFEPTRPAQDGLFTTLTASTTKDAERTKTLWKAGARSLRWKAEDANEDQLRYLVEVMPVGGNWMPVAEDIEATFLTLDATVLPDGSYRFRVTADDGESNPTGDALEHSVVSPLVVLDQTPPVLGKVSEQGGRIEVEIEDQTSPLRSIEVSQDGEPWQPASVADGSVDEKSETVLVEVDPEDTGFLIVRATDRAHNHAVFSLP